MSSYRTTRTKAPGQVVPPPKHYLSDSSPCKGLSESDRWSAIREGPVGQKRKES